MSDKLGGSGALLRKYSVGAYWSAARDVVVFAESEKEAREKLDDALDAEPPLTLDEVEFDQFSDITGEEEASPDELAAHLVANAARWWLANLEVDENEWDARMRREMDTLGLAGQQREDVGAALGRWLERNGRPVAGELKALVEEC